MGTDKSFYITVEVMKSILWNMRLLVQVLITGCCCNSCLVPRTTCLRGKPVGFWVRLSQSHEPGAQGDREAAEGLAVSPLCDRQHVDVPKSQITFLDYVVSPCFEALRGLAPATAEAALANIGVARHHWEDQPRRNPSTMFSLDDLP